MESKMHLINEMNPKGGLDTQKNASHIQPWRNIFSKVRSTLSAVSSYTILTSANNLTGCGISGARPALLRLDSYGSEITRDSSDHEQMHNYCRTNVTSAVKTPRQSYSLKHLLGNYTYPTFNPLFKSSNCGLFNKEMDVTCAKTSMSLPNSVVYLDDEVEENGASVDCWLSPVGKYMLSTLAGCPGAPLHEEKSKPSLKERKLSNMAPQKPHEKRCSAGHQNFSRTLSDVFSPLRDNSFSPVKASNCEGVASHVYSTLSGSPASEICHSNSSFVMADAANNSNTAMNTAAKPIPPQTVDNSMDQSGRQPNVLYQRKDKETKRSAKKKKRQRRQKTNVYSSCKPSQVCDNNIIDERGQNANGVDCKSTTLSTLDKPSCMFSKCFLSSSPVRCSGSADSIARTGIRETLRRLSLSLDDMKCNEAPADLMESHCLCDDEVWSEGKSECCACKFPDKSCSRLRQAVDKNYTDAIFDLESSEDEFEILVKSVKSATIPKQANDKSFTFFESDSTSTDENELNSSQNSEFAKVDEGIHVQQHKFASFFICGDDMSDSGDCDDYDNCTELPSKSSPDEICAEFFDFLPKNFFTCSVMFRKAQPINENEDKSSKKSVPMRKDVREANVRWNRSCGLEPFKSSSCVSSRREIRAKQTPSKVTFANDCDLITVHHLDDASEESRKGIWEQYGIDHCRFEKRIKEVECVIAPCLSIDHKLAVRRRFYANGTF